MKHNAILKNIVIIGLPGSGKTACGQRLAQMLGRKFVDLDTLVEKTAGTSINVIFAEKGEDAFRNMETQAAQKTAAENGIIIATGGGIVLRPENMEILAKNGIILFLNRPPEKIAQDILTYNRPLIQKDPQKIFSIYKERIGLYQKYYDIEIKNQGTMEEVLFKLKKIAVMATETKEVKFAVIGSPIVHSLSPNIHLPLLRRFYNKVSYIREEVLFEQLPNWLNRVRQENFSGFNITMPYKREIMPLLDYIDAEAVLLDSVNTVVNQNGILKGYNTDAEGFKLALRQKGKSLTKSNIVILGSGGVAGTLALKAVKEGANKISIAAIKTLEAQKILLGAAALNCKTVMEITGFSKPELTKICKEADILINATPLGMTGIKADFADTAFLQALAPQSLVCDLIYSPARTNLLKQAENLGLDTMGGLNMLIYQAILADALFLGINQNIQKAYHTAIQNLPGKVELS